MVFLLPHLKCTFCIDVMNLLFRVQLFGAVFPFYTYWDLERDQKCVPVGPRESPRISGLEALLVPVIY